MKSLLHKIGLFILNMPQWQNKCWGQVWHRFYDHITNESLLEVRQGWQCSIHLHEHRYNAFISTTATIGIEVWDQKHNVELLLLSKNQVNLSLIIPPDHITYLRPGQFYVVAPNIFHRFYVIESGQLIEIYWTANQHKCSLGDIIRIEEGGPRS